MEELNKEEMLGTEGGACRVEGIRGDELSGPFQQGNYQKIMVGKRVTNMYVTAVMNAYGDKRSFPIMPTLIKKRGRTIVRTKGEGRRILAISFDNKYLYILKEKGVFGIEIKYHYTQFTGYTGGSTGSFTSGERTVTFRI